MRHDAAKKSVRERGGQGVVKSQLARNEDG